MTRWSGAVASAITVFGLSAGLAPAAALEFSSSCRNSDTGHARSLTVAAVGDLLFHKSLQRAGYARDGEFAKMLGPVRHILAGADMTYGNLEGPTADGVAGLGRKTRDPGRRLDRHVYDGFPMFNYHPSVLDGLKAAGFDVVSTANNHSLDRGPLGIERTITNLAKRGIQFTGTRGRESEGGPWSTVVERKGVRVAWLACAEMTNGIRDRYGQVLSCFKDKDSVLGEIRSLAGRDDVDAIILTPHWGEENIHRPAKRQRTLAREAVEAGALAVIGTHPHVTQPWEKITTPDGREGLAIYSTGNFLAGQVRLMQRAGLIALIKLVKGPGEKARIAAAGYVPTWVARGGTIRVVVNSSGEGSGAALAGQLRLLPRASRLPGRWPAKLRDACEARRERLARDLSAGASPHNDRPGAALALATLLEGEALHAALQKELARLGCNPGPVDGRWGGKSRRALQRFVTDLRDKRSSGVDGGAEVRGQSRDPEPPEAGELPSPATLRLLRRSVAPACRPDVRAPSAAASGEPAATRKVARSKLKPLGPTAAQAVNRFGSDR